MIQRRFGVQLADGVQAGVEFAAVHFEGVQRDPAHARGDAQVGDDVGAVSNLDADLGMRRAGGAHQVGYDIHRAPAHATVEEGTEHRLGLVGRHPVVGGPGVYLARRADIGEVFGAGHVGRATAVQVRVRVRLFVDGDKLTCLEHVLDERAVFGFGPVAPDDLIGARELRAVFHPGLKQRCPRHASFSPHH